MPLHITHSDHPPSALAQRRKLMFEALLAKT
jgi:hypothetical protein